MANETDRKRYSVENPGPAAVSLARYAGEKAGVTIDAGHVQAVLTNHSEWQAWRNSARDEEGLTEADRERKARTAEREEANREVNEAKAAAKAQRDAERQQKAEQRESEKGVREWLRAEREFNQSAKREQREADRLAKEADRQRKLEERDKKRQEAEETAQQKRDQREAAREQREAAREAKATAKAEGEGAVEGDTEEAPAESTRGRFKGREGRLNKVGASKSSF
jgi:hypothetical protein